jgi:hypothetical protein
MSPSHPLALPPPARRIARTCPDCGGEVRLWGEKRPRLYCIDKKGCGWVGPPPTDALLKRQGNQMLPGLEVSEDEHLSDRNPDHPRNAAGSPAPRPQAADAGGATEAGG